MAIALEGFSETVNSTAGTSCVVNVPAGTVNGDVLLVTIDRTLNSPGDVTAPAGWTAVDAQSEGHATSVSSVSFWRVASSEPASYNFTWTGNAKNVGRMSRWSGAAAVSTVSDVDSFTTTSATHTSPAVTTPADDCMLVRHGCFQSNGSLALNTPPSGTQLDSGQTSGGGSVLSVSYYATQATAGSTGTASWTVSASVRAACWTIVITPAAGGSPVSGLVTVAEVNRASQALAITPGSLAQPVTTSSHARAAQSATVTLGAIQEALGASVATRAPQGADVTPGGASQALAPATMARTAMGLNYALGVASAVLTPAAMERLAYGLGVSMATVVGLEVAVAVRTPQGLGVTTGTALESLTPAAMERLAHAIGATTGQIHNLVVAVSVKTSLGMVGSPGGVSDHLIEAHQTRASLDTRAMPGGASHGSTHATARRVGGDLSFQAGPASQELMAALAERLAWSVSSIPGATSVTLDEATSQRLAILIGAVQGLSVSLTPAQATRTALDAQPSPGAIIAALGLSQAARTALGVVFSSATSARLEAALAERLATMAGVTPSQLQASITAASRLVQAHALGADPGAIIQETTVAGAQRTAQELSIFIGLLLQELYGYHRMSPGQRGKRLDVPHRGKTMSVSATKTERALFRRTQYPGTAQTWSMDWNKRMAEEGATVTASSWSCDNPDLTIGTDQLNANVATVQVSGPAGVYQLLNSVDLSNGDDDVATIILTISPTGDTIR